MSAMDKPKKRRGAPRKKDPRTKVARFRCTPEELTGYHRKAKRAKTKLSPWLKKLADDA
jgi:hypothetical protein